MGNSVNVDSAVVFQADMLLLTHSIGIWDIENSAHGLPICYQIDGSVSSRIHLLPNPDLLICIEIQLGMLFVRCRVSSGGELHCTFLPLPGEPKQTMVEGVLSEIGHWS